MDLKETYDEIINFAKNRKGLDFEKSVNDVLNQKIGQLIDNKKAEVAQSLINKQSIEESYEGKNIIDGLARIVDMDGKGYPAKEYQCMTLDNGDEVDVTPVMASRLLDFIKMEGRDEKEQYQLQNKIRRSKEDFMNVLAAAGGNVVDYSEGNY